MLIGQAVLRNLVGTGSQAGSDPAVVGFERSSCLYTQLWRAKWRKERHLLEETAEGRTVCLAN